MYKNLNRPELLFKVKTTFIHQCSVFYISISHSLNFMFDERSLQNPKRKKSYDVFSQTLASKKIQK